MIAIRFPAAACTFLLVASASAATFNYHGNLQESGKPANGVYDLQLTLYSEATGGRVLAGPLSVDHVPVSNGEFSTEVDFKSSSLTGPAWLAVSVRAAGTEEFATLATRAAVSAAATTTSSVCPGAWTLNGNAGNPSGTYLGTADNNPLTFEVNGSIVGQILPTNSNTNIVFGDDQTIQSGVGVTLIGGTQNTANADFTFVGGGILNSALGSYDSVLGGAYNSANGRYSTVAGGQFNHAYGDFSFAAGYNAYAAYNSDFVWSDPTAGSAFTSTGPNQFLIYAGGGVGIGTNNPGNFQLKVLATNQGINGETSNGTDWGVSGFNDATSGNGAGVYGTSASTQGYGVAGYASAAGGVGTLGYTDKEAAFGLVAANTAGGTALLVQGTGATSGRVISSDAGGYLSSGGQWVNKSDRAAKSGFQSLNVSEILARVVAMPVTRWFYKAEGEAVQHIGPVAQDFFAAFGVGADDTSIGTVDEGGVALAAIQGLDQKLESAHALLDADAQALRLENAALKADNAVLQSELDALAHRVERLEATRSH